MGQIDVIMRASNANALDDIGRLLTKLRVTGTPALSFSVTVATYDEDRQDAILQNIRNDPNVVIVGNPS
jgi:hypothetical protein